MSFNNLTFEEAFNKLREEGLEPGKTGSVISIRNIFGEKALTDNPHIGRDRDGYMVDDISYRFTSEIEAEIFWFVKTKIMPQEQDLMKLIRRMALICHVCGIETNYSF
jgi:hypothetical protein